MGIEKINLKITPARPSVLSTQSTQRSALASSIAFIAEFGKYLNITMAYDSPPSFALNNIINLDMCSRWPRRLRTNAAYNTLAV